MISCHSVTSTARCFHSSLEFNRSPIFSSSHYKSERCRHIIWSGFNFLLLCYFEIFVGALGRKPSASSPLMTCGSTTPSTERLMLSQLISTRCLQHRSVCLPGVCMFVQCVSGFPTSGSRWRWIWSYINTYRYECSILKHDLRVLLKMNPVAQECKSHTQIHS